MKRQVQSIFIAAGLAAATLLSTSPAAAYTPIFMKICGVDGESSGSEAKPERKPTKPVKKDSTAPRSDIITGAGPGAGPGRTVKKPDSKPARALLVPAIQKAG